MTWDASYVAWGMHNYMGPERPLPPLVLPFGRPGMGGFPNEYYHTTQLDVPRYSARRVGNDTIPFVRPPPAEANMQQAQAAPASSGAGRPAHDTRRPRVLPRLTVAPSQTGPRWRDRDDWAAGRRRTGCPPWRGGDCGQRCHGSRRCCCSRRRRAGRGRCAALHRLCAAPRHRSRNGLGGGSHGGHRQRGVTNRMTRRKSSRTGGWRLLARQSWQRRLPRWRATSQPLPLPSLPLAAPPSALRRSPTLRADQILARSRRNIWSVTSLNSAPIGRCWHSRSSSAIS